MPDYHYSYLIGTLLFVAAWGACFVLGKKYRAQMIWGSLVSAPFALTSLLFVPQYWTPPSLGNLDQRFHVGIEDVLWAAAVGGIASAIGEIFLKERLSRIRSRRPTRHYAPFVVMAIAFVILELWHPGKTIYNTVAAFTLCALIVAVVRSDLIPLMLTGAVTFTVLYLGLFVYFLLLYPEFVQRYYNVPNLLGIYILGVPIEEPLFAASGGAVWSVAYEYLQGYRIVSDASGKRHLTDIARAS
jgi:hypothetical protein